MMNTNHFRITALTLAKSLGGLSKAAVHVNRPSFAPSCRSFSSGYDMKDDEIRALFHKWNNALATLDATTVANLYVKSPTPVLLSTVSNKTRTDFAGLKDYFETFLKLKPQGVIVESYVTKGDNWCCDCGVYDFTLRETGAKVLARYTFIYMFEDGEWKIYHHHSSAMPEKTP